MAQVLDKHLVKAVVDLAVFLEFSPESILDLDASVEAMEQLASELGLMPDESKRSFVQITQELAKSYAERADFVSGLADSLGLAGN